MEILKFYYARIQVDFEIAYRRDDVQPWNSNIFKNVFSILILILSFHSSEQGHTRNLRGGANFCRKIAKKEFSLAFLAFCHRIDTTVRKLLGENILLAHFTIK